MRAIDRLADTWRHKEGLLGGYGAAVFVGATFYWLTQQMHWLFGVPAYEVTFGVDDLGYLVHGVREMSGASISMWLVGLLVTSAFALPALILIVVLFSLMSVKSFWPFAIFGAVLAGAIVLGVSTFNGESTTPECWIADAQPNLARQCRTSIVREIFVHSVQSISVPLALLTFWALGWRPMIEDVVWSRKIKTHPELVSQ